MELNIKFDVKNGQQYQKLLFALSEILCIIGICFISNFLLKVRVLHLTILNRFLRFLRSLFPEDRIRVFNPASGTWTPGIVQHVADTPRSYLVANEKGGTLRRNCRHLRATGESFQFRSDELPDDVPVADSISCTADRKERGTSSAPISPVSAACSSAEPTESAEPSIAAVPAPVQPLRRSSRRIKAPDRLNL